MDGVRRSCYALVVAAVALNVIPTAVAAGASTTPRALFGPEPFIYTGSEQSFEVPANDYWLQIDARGASGGANAGVTGSAGGEASADVQVHPGEKLYIEVGGAGHKVDDGSGNCQAVLGERECLGTFGGWNGGGNGGPAAPLTCSPAATCPSAASGAGGGGSSDVRLAPRSHGAASLASALVIAGGGGGVGAPGLPGGSFGISGTGGAAPAAGAHGQASDGSNGSPAVDPSFDVGGQGGVGGGGAGGLGGAGGAAKQAPCVAANPAPACFFQPHYNQGIAGLTSKSSCPPNHFSFSLPDPAAASTACGGYGGGGSAFTSGSDTVATGGGGGGGGGGYDGGGGGGGGATHTNNTGAGGYEGGGGGGGGGGASWVSQRVISLGPISGSSALHAHESSDGNGEVVLYIEGPFSALYDGTPAGSSSSVSSSGLVASRETCRGPATSTCVLIATLSATETVSAGKVISAFARKTRRKVILGRRNTTLRAGATANVGVALDALGRRLLRRLHGRSSR